MKKKKEWKSIIIEKIVKQAAQNATKYTSRLKSNDVAFHALEDHGQRLDYMTAYRGAMYINNETVLEGELSFQLINPWLLEMKKLNQNATIKMEKKLRNEFTRSFICFDFVKILVEFRYLCYFSMRVT